MAEAAADEAFAKLLDAKHALLNEIERLTSLLSVDTKIMQERRDALEEVTRSLTAIQSAPHLDTSSPSKWVQLNIGGHNVDIQREALSGAQWNLLSQTLSPEWSEFLLKDSEGRIFFDFDLDWIDPIFSYFRAFRLCDEESRGTLSKLLKPSNFTPQSRLGYACVLHYFDLSNFDTPLPTAHGAGTRLVGRADELMDSLARHVDGFCAQASSLRNENVESQQREDRLLREVIFVRDLVKQWMIQAHGDRALLQLHEQRVNAVAQAEPDSHSKTEGRTSPFTELSGSDTTFGGQLSSLKLAVRRLDEVLRARRAVSAEEDRSPTRPIAFFNVGGHRVCVLRNSLLQAFPGSLFAKLLQDDPAACAAAAQGAIQWEVDSNGHICLDVPKEAFLALISYARLHALRGEGTETKIFVPSEQLDVFFALQDLLQISDDFPLEST